MSLRSVFARNLRSVRLEAGLSQEALAEAAGFDRTYISHLERERYSASLDTIEAIARVFRIEAHLLIATQSYGED